MCPRAVLPSRQDVVTSVRDRLYGTTRDVSRGHALSGATWLQWFPCVGMNVPATLHAPRSTLHAPRSTLHAPHTKQRSEAEASNRRFIAEE
jgi:hypothetical protein